MSWVSSHRNSALLIEAVRDATGKKKYERTYNSFFLDELSGEAIVWTLWKFPVLFELEVLNISMMSVRVVEEDFCVE